MHLIVDILEINDEKQSSEIQKNKRNSASGAKEVAGDRKHAQHDKRHRPSPGAAETIREVRSGDAPPARRALSGHYLLPGGGKTSDENSRHRLCISVFHHSGGGNKLWLHQHITFSPYGEYWRQLRKICTLELLSMKRVQSFRWLREKVFVGLTRRFAAMEGSEINFSKDFNASVFSLISRAALGEKTEQLEVLHPMINELADLAAGFDIADVFPSIKLFQMMSSLKRRVTVIHKDIDRILENVIDEHRVANSVKTEDEEDLLDVLLKYQRDGLDFSLTNDNIKSVIVDMLSGGSETSGTTVEWAMSVMMKNPKILEKAQEEVRKVFDEEGYVDESRIPQLKYLKLVVKETLRMHPALPLMLPRKCREACEVDGYTIPADAKVIVNGWAINRDPKYWKDGDCFEPERFLENLVDYKGNNFEYIPFGAGRRMCPGMSFGLANVELPLALFLYHFDWKLGGGMKPEDLDMTEGVGITARRLKHLYLVPTIKRPLPVQ